jgi:hypothetical protein
MTDADRAYLGADEPRRHAAGREGAWLLTGLISLALAR